MNIHDMTEVAYKNGYEAGVKDSQAEIEQWKEEANRYQNLWCESDSDIHKIKLEAIKKFAQKLKAISHPYGDTQMVFELQIDNLLKEMESE